MTVIVGPNGSGKSTLLDVLAFIQEITRTSLDEAWSRAGRMVNLRSRGSAGPVEIDLTYSDDRTEGTQVRYEIAIDEVGGTPTVVRERLRWAKNDSDDLYEDVLDFRDGRGYAHEDGLTGRLPRLDSLSPGSLALVVFGQQDRYGRVQHALQALRDWQVSRFSVDRAREIAAPGPQRRLAPDGQNLPNVLQHLTKRQPEDLDRIVAVLRRQIPQVADVDALVLPSDRLLLRLVDAPFEDPVLARYVSEGTVKLLAYLVLLNADPLPGLLGVEEPDNLLHSRLIYGLTDEMRVAADRSQLIVTTHSPYLMDAVRPEELWVLYRGDDGYAQVSRAADIPRLVSQVDAGGSLGDLWMEGYFDVGDPLTRGGRPRDRSSGT
jgi:predicted ATPase